MQDTSPNSLPQIRLYDESMVKALGSLFLFAAAAFAQYTVTPAGAPPAEASALAPLLQKDGAKIAGPNSSTVEFWLLAAMPPAATPESNATLPIAHGMLLGVARVTGQYADRRGQSIKPGVYTLRYSVYPMNGDHQGVAPQRDFFILSRIADDKDPKTPLAYDPLMDLSRKASGTPHPLCLSAWKGGNGDGKLTQEGEHDWILNGKLGNTPVSLIAAGKSEG